MLIFNLFDFVFEDLKVQILLKIVWILSFKVWPHIKGLALVLAFQSRIFLLKNYQQSISMNVYINDIIHKIYGTIVENFLISKGQIRQII